MNLNPAGKDSNPSQTCEMNVNDFGIWVETRKTPCATGRFESDRRRKIS
jgi:hypothetical protein